MTIETQDNYPSLKMRLIAGSIPRAVGGEFIITGEGNAKTMSLVVTEDPQQNGHHTSRVIYNIFLNYKTILDIHNSFNRTGFVESVIIDGSGSNPALSLYVEEDVGINPSTGYTIGYGWSEFYIRINPAVLFQTEDIKDYHFLSFYLTSIDPSSSLQTTQRSFGKYINESPMLESSVLSSKFSLYDLTMNVGDTSQVVNTKYIQVNSEIMSVESYSDDTLYVQSRKMHDTMNQLHLNTDKLYFLDVNRVFNSSFGENYSGGLEQFRCFAVVNDSDAVLDDFDISTRAWDDIGKSNFSFFVEAPMVESFATTSIHGSFDFFDVDEIDYSSYVNMPDEGIPSTLFVDQMVSFVGGENDGQQRIIISFSPDLNRFFLNEDLPYQIGVGDQILFHTSPSSTSYTGTIDPRSMNNSIYSEEVEIKEGQSLSLNGLNRAHENSLLPGDVLYLWIKRSLEQTSTVSDEMPSLDFLYNVG